MKPMALNVKMAEVVHLFGDLFRSHSQKPLEECIHEERELRDHLSEKQIDRMVADSFPASDPPSSY